MIIDYHSHLVWDPINDTYDIDACLKDMQENHIDKRVISALQGYSITHQNDVVANAVKQYPDRLVGCAVINPKEQDVLLELQRIIDLDCFVAIELDSNEHCYFPEVAPHMEEIMTLCENNGLIVNVFTGWGCRTMPAQWAIYAKKHPKLTMVLLHMGTTDFGYGCVDLVKDFESGNLYVETSCMYEFPILRKAFSCISPDRFLFGTHYPHKFTDCSIHTFDLLKLENSLADSLFYRNAQRLLHL